MSRPPVTDAARRGHSSFAGDKARALIPQARLAGPMPWVLAIMVALVLVWAELAVGVFGTPFAGS